MLVALLAAAQLTGWLPPPPPRKPITDPIFAASPIRELRRNWDDCIWEVKQLVFMNGVTDEKSAVDLMNSACADYDDQLTGALVNNIGYAKATRAMAKAHQEAASSMREYVKQVAIFLRSAPAPTPKPQTKPLWTTARASNGACQSTYSTGSGAGARTILFESRGSDLRSSGTIGFVFPRAGEPDLPTGRAKPISFNIIIRGEGGATQQLKVRGRLGQDGGEAYVVTDYGDQVRSAVETSGTLASVIISGPWGADPVEFPARGLSKMVGDTLSCVTQASQ